MPRYVHNKHSKQKLTYTERNINMKKVVIYIAMSIDGFIADKNGGVDFLQGDGSDPNNMGTYEEFYNNVSDVIMGYNTYNQVVTELAPGNYPYKGKKSYVFTRKSIASTQEVIFTSESIKSVISKLKQSDEEGVIWINGGASIVNEVIEECLFDELIVSIIPTILGGGIKLFSEKSAQHKLKLLETSNSNGIVEIKYSAAKA